MMPLRLSRLFAGMFLEKTEYKEQGS